MVARRSRPSKGLTMYPCGDTRFARSSVSASANAVRKTTGTASSARSRSAAAMPSGPSRSEMSIRTRAGRSSAAREMALAYEAAVPTTWYPSRRSRPWTSSATTASSSTTRMRAGFAGSTGSAPSDCGVRSVHDGEGQREPCPGVALDRRDSSQLLHERPDQLLPERPGMLLAIRQRWQPDAVVGHDEGRGAVRAAERDADRAALTVGKRMLQSVREQLVQDEPAGDCDVEVQRHRLNVESEPDRSIHFSRRREHVPREPVDVVTEVDPREVARSIELLVDQGHRANPVLALVEEARGFQRCRVVFGLEAEEARDHLEIVLHAMMHLAQQRIFLGERAAQLLLDLLAVPDVLRDPHAALRKSRAVVEVSWRADDRQGCATPCHPLGLARAAGAVAGPANQLSHVAPDQLGLAPPELLDRGPVHRLHATSRVGCDEHLAPRPDEVVHVGLRHRGHLDARRHVVE